MTGRKNDKKYEKPWKQNAKEEKEPEEKPKTFLNEVYPDGKGPDAALIESLEREIVQKDLSTTFDDIAELEDVFSLLRPNKRSKKRSSGL